MRKLISAAAIAAVLYVGIHQYHSGGPGRVIGNADVVANAYRDHASNLQVSGQGKVTKILADDRSGSRHQRFLLKLDSGLIVLIAHNIELAPRIDALNKGDQVEFCGEYEWNEKGGVIHWTHDDPQHRHPDGWLKHKGVVYQ